MSTIPTLLDKESLKAMSDVIRKERQIMSLKKQLSDTDYIFIKIKEYEEVSENKPYSDEFIAEKHAERQAIREQINELED